MYRKTDEAAAKEVYPSYAGWCGLFPGYQFLCEDSDPLDYQNYHRNRTQLVKYLTEFPPSSHQPNLSSLLDLNGIQASYIWLPSKRKEKITLPFQPITDKAQIKREKDHFLKTVTDWELYRRFAAFCDACNEYEQEQGDLKFNLTLSMALFAKMWSFNVENFAEVMPEDDEFIRPITLEDISTDALRADIVKVVRMPDSDLINIHSIVRARKIWLLRNAYDMEPYISQEL